MTIINLKFSDGDVISMDLETARQFGVTLDLDEDVQKTVKLPEVVKTDILEKLIEWAIYHKDDPPLPEDSEDQEICGWDQNFLNIVRNS